jgi:hypothetical protein
VTFVLVAGSTSTGQFRTATRETTTTATGVLSGAAGDFAPFLRFSATPSSQPPVLDYEIADDGQGIEFSWPAGFILQYQSNVLMIGLDSTWVEYPASSSPVQVSVDRALGTMFFRLAQAP